MQLWVVAVIGDNADSRICGGSTDVEVGVLASRVVVHLCRLNIGF